MSTIYSELKRVIGIQRVIGGYTKLRDNNNYCKGNCPICGEDKESLTICVPKQIFYCFSCHRGGDIINFISKLRDINETEAAHYLAMQFNIELHCCPSHEMLREIKERLAVLELKVNEKERP